MGWFWADPAPAPPRAPNPIPTPHASPPPGCPMHAPGAAAPATTAPPSGPPPTSACPYVPPDSTPTGRPSTLSKLNPLNYMPTHIPNTKSPHQSVTLPLSREPSTIPKGDGSGTWEYPSPQQMYNAMLRKGYTDTPADAVEAMVAVHNFLNEGAWAEIVEWERRFHRGMLEGVKRCVHGEEGSVSGADIGSDWPDEDTAPPRLTRFMGRPGDLTPKARILQALGSVWPARFGGEAPFDRHDWFVRRSLPGGGETEVRYVIDYYSGPPEESGEPVFFLDVRPAVDTPSAALARVARWGGDVWWRGTGGAL
ncbi:cytochrome c and c1 heme-lyase [Trichodelitschia bisporula]|uniref:Holocytochrome c-type synthase n=1 Tax=Trichodelitschia bisporula TaxID=703511 RepID=A0A6G1HJS3_9PEZI|nr:cytochrome c and c1 heme-lyase [Trichodelitschia bisporula]